jgi:hypothetical protein
MRMNRRLAAGVLLVGAGLTGCSSEIPNAHTQALIDEAMQPTEPTTVRVNSCGTSGDLQHARVTLSSTESGSHGYTVDLTGYDATGRAVAYLSGKATGVVPGRDNTIDVQATQPGVTITRCEVTSTSRDY